jgi:hypothetical protein
MTCQFMHVGNERLLIGEICLNVSVVYQSQQHRSRQGLTLHNARRKAVRQKGCILDCLAAVTQSLTQNTSITFHALTWIKIGCVLLVRHHGHRNVFTQALVDESKPYILSTATRIPTTCKFYDISYNISHMNIFIWTCA